VPAQVLVSSCKGRQADHERDAAVTIGIGSHLQDSSDLYRCLVTPVTHHQDL